MAISKKSTTGKRAGWKTKKKTKTKKSSRKSGTSKLDALVERKVEKLLGTGEKHKVTMELQMEQVSIFIKIKHSLITVPGSHHNSDTRAGWWWAWTRRTQEGNEQGPLDHPQSKLKSRPARSKAPPYPLDL